MKILHLTIGKPNDTSGGLPKYAYDLAVDQHNLGHDVSLMFPGRTSIFGDKSKIVETRYNNLKCFEIINPNFVPIPYGLKNPLIITKARKAEVFKDFFSKYNFDIIHVHTFMGFNISFFENAKANQQKLIYTSHDYFILCAKTNFIDYKNEVCSGPTPEKCARCNINVKNRYISRFIRGNVFKVLKQTKIGKYLKYKYRSTTNSNSQSLSVAPITNEYIKIYDQYLKYNAKLINFIDFIHFNSELTKTIFTSNGINKSNQVINISLKHIMDNRNEIKHNYNNRIRVGYIGPNNFAKGIGQLVSVMDEIQKKTPNISLIAWGDNFEEYQKKFNFVVSKGKFSSTELKKVFESFDLLVVPSIWNETFGFITLEALSYDIPVVVSQNVGSKDLLKHNKIGKIYENSIDLKNILSEITENKEFLKTEKERIKTINSQEFCFRNHSLKLLNLYKNFKDNS